MYSRPSAVRIRETIDTLSTISIRSVNGPKSLSQIEIGGGNALIILQFAVCCERAQDSWTVQWIKGKKTI